MVDPGELGEAPPLEADAEWHDVTWGVTRVSSLWSGDRRLEAATYLSDGYGKRVAIEARPTGWSALGRSARVWQPGRLKGITVPDAAGVPFLSAGQMFEAEPAARKWLSREQTRDASEREVEPGVLLLSCSGSVGRVTAAYQHHVGHIVTHDLLRVEPLEDQHRGWLYAYMRTSDFRDMATGAHYGHMIKHLEPAHVDALPVLDIEERLAIEFNSDFEKVMAWRESAATFVAEARGEYGRALDVDKVTVDLDAPFEVSARELMSGRRRLDAYHHNSLVAFAEEQMQSVAERVDTVSGVTKRVWWPGRFKRAFGENGTPYVSAAELFDLNGPITKLIHAGLVENAPDYFVEPGWLLMARSGQIYGLNGRVLLASERESNFFVSEDIIRIEADPDRIRAGYLQMVLGHPTLGRPLVIRHAYGTSIPHLEPPDLRGIPVPRFAAGVEDSIADKMEEAAAYRSRADTLENAMTARAETLIEQFIHADI